MTLCDPVAGYSSFLTRTAHLKDLGDSEQTPCDLATVADYTHFTALLAPRAALLTFNSKDNCCFESGYALQPLLNAARPIYRLLGRPDALRLACQRQPRHAQLRTGQPPGPVPHAGRFLLPRR